MVYLGFFLLVAPVFSDMEATTDMPAPVLKPHKKPVPTHKKTAATRSTEKPAVMALSNDDLPKRRRNYATDNVPPVPATPGFSNTPIIPPAGTPSPTATTPKLVPATTPTPNATSTNPPAANSRSATTDINTVSQSASDVGTRP